VVADIACRTGVYAVAVCYETLVRVPALTRVGLRFCVEQVVPA